MNDETPRPLNLRQKMAAVMRDIVHVDKKGKHPKFNYAFAQASDVFVAVREAFLAHGIVFLSSERGTVLLPEQAESQSGNAIFRVFLQMHFTLLDTESDEKLEAFHTGEAMDNQDKGANKAKTAALKGFLLQTFLIPTGDDTEAEDHEVKGKGQPAGQKGTGPAACPSCGNVGSILKDNKGKEEWFCWAKRGGCGARFATDPAIPAAVSEPKAAPPNNATGSDALASEPIRKAMWAACQSRAKQLNQPETVAWAWKQQMMSEIGVPLRPDGTPDEERMTMGQVRMIIMAAPSAEMGESPADSFEREHPVQ